MVTKSFQVRPDNTQWLNTALLATSMVRTGWEERSWFSPLSFQWQGHFELWFKKIYFGLYKPVVIMVPDKASPPWGWDCPNRSSPSLKLKCLPPWPAGLLPAGKGGHLALQGHWGPKEHLLHMVQLGGAPGGIGHLQSLATDDPQAIFFNINFKYCMSFPVESWSDKKFKVFKSTVTFHKTNICFCLMFWRK